MFIVNTEIEINWGLPSMLVPIPLANFDVRVRKPDGSVIVDQSAILEENYVVPTDTTTGVVSYPLTPDTKGVWLVVLVVEEEDRKLYYEYYLKVWENDTQVYQQVRL